MCSGRRSVGRRTRPSGKSPSSSTARPSGRALEVERGGVDAVAPPRGRGAVVEDVAEVATAGRARDLRANHPIARIGLGDDAVERRGLVEARPTAPGLELRVGTEE